MALPLHHLHGEKMACSKPLLAYKTPSGAITFHAVPNSNTIRLPCQQCWRCRLEYSRQWAVRILHESKMHLENDYITLTYAEEHLPENGILNYRHFQAFLRRTRKHLKPKKIRFYAAGEYGEKTQRPHFHAIIFGHSFTEKSPLGKSPSGFPLYRSAQLEKLWPWGHSSTGEVTFETAAYVARYVMKKINGDAQYEHYTRTNKETGEIYLATKEMSHMSLKPGIGKTWLDQNAADVYPEGKVITNGKEVNAPKYYDKKHAEKNKAVIDELKAQRQAEGRARWRDNTQRRLDVKEQIAIARTNLIRRKL